MASNDEFIILQDENGTEVKFELLDTVDYLGENYVVLLAEDDDSQVYIFKYIQDDGSDSAEYLGIDDDEVIEAVFDVFKQRYKDEIDFN